VVIKHKKIILQTRPNSNIEKKKQVLDDWYRFQLKEAIPYIVSYWEKIIGVDVEGVTVRHMKTRWGTCTPHKKTIRINLELVKKPRECLEYILVHEMLHLLEPTHNSKFVKLMERYMPKWRFYRDGLNRLPVRHESWLY
jgi:hypothetical protein